MTQQVIKFPGNGCYIRNVAQQNPFDGNDEGVNWTVVQLEPKADRVNVKRIAGMLLIAVATSPLVETLLYLLG